MSYEVWGEPDDGPELPEGWLDEDAAQELRDRITELEAQLAARDAQSVRDAELDSARLDYLDKRNARKNEQYGTKYGWQLNENHNRIALEDHAFPAVSVREAIDQAMKDVPLKPVSDEVKP